MCTLYLLLSSIRRQEPIVHVQFSKIHRLICNPCEVPDCDMKTETIVIEPYTQLYIK